MCMIFPDGKKWLGLLSIPIEITSRHFCFIPVQKKRRDGPIIDKGHIHGDSEPRRAHVLKSGEDSIERAG